MATVKDYFRSKLPAKIYGRKTNAGLLVGLEVELENIVFDEAPKEWKREEDGSLKFKGKEYTLPVWNTHALPYLEALFKSVKTAEANSRCSIHVHCNILDFTERDITSLIILYVIFERALYHYSGKRWNNIYCVPVQTWFNNINITKQFSLDEISMMFPKYSGMNILPDKGKLGTVEFRHMAGNKNPRYISTWINILVKLVKAAKRYPVENLVEQIKTMRQTSQYWDLFSDVFEEYAQVLNYSTFNQDVEKGITFAKLITTD